MWVVIATEDDVREAEATVVTKWPAWLSGVGVATGPNHAEVLYDAMGLDILIFEVDPEQEKVTEFRTKLQGHLDALKAACQFHNFWLMEYREDAGGGAYLSFTEGGTNVSIQFDDKGDVDSIDYMQYGHKTSLPRGEQKIQDILIGDA